MNNNAMFNLSYGLFVLTSQLNGKDNGCIVNTVTQVTVSPNQIAVAVNKQNLTHDMIKVSGVFNVSILSEKSKFATYKHWGMQSGTDTDKLEAITYKRSANGLVYIEDEANAFISAKVVNKIDLGTHTLFIAEVTDCEVISEDPSVTYAYYHKNIKEVPQAKTEAKKGFICVICGYIYEGDTLPEDYICPICKHPASDFKPL